VLLQDVLSSSLSILLELAVLGRVFLVAILAERNVVLADSIRLQCEQVKKSQKGSSNPVVVAVLGVKNNKISLLMKRFKLFNYDETVLTINHVISGMAHCNGIKRMMTTATTAE